MQELTSSVPSNIRQRLGWTGVLLVALSMYLFRIGHEPLWLDETYSYSMVQHSFLDIVKLSTNDVHPPLYYLYLKAGTLLFGTSPAALRLPSVIAALGLLALAVFPVRRLFGLRTAYVFALLVATSPGIVCFAQEARMYTLAAFLVTGAGIYGRLALIEGRRADRFCFSFFTWAAAMTHYFGLIAVAVNGLYIVITARTKYRRHWKSVALAVLSAGLLYSPWLIPLGWQLTAVTKGFWIPPMNLNLFIFALVAPFTYKFEDVPYPWQALAALVILSIVLVGSIVISIWRGPKSSFEARTQLLFVYASTLAFALVFSGFIQPILMPRYLMVCAGVLLLATASGIDALVSRIPTSNAAGHLPTTGKPDAFSPRTAMRRARLPPAATPTLGAFTTGPLTENAFNALASKSALSSAGVVAAHDPDSPKLAVRFEASHLSLALLVGALLALGLPASLRIQREVFNGPFHELAERVKDATAPARTAHGPSLPDEVPIFLHMDGQTLYPAWHAIPMGRHVLVLDRNGSFDVSQGGVYETRRLVASRDLEGTLANTNHLWLVDMEPTGFHLSPERILAHPGWQQASPAVALNLPMSWVKIRLSYFEQRRQPLPQ